MNGNVLDWFISKCRKCKFFLIVLELNIFRKKFKNSLEIITNIYRIQTYDSIICGYFCIGVIGFMLKSKSLLKDNLFSPGEYKKYGEVILKYFQ